MPTIRSLKTWLRLSDSFSYTVFHSNWQYFTHSNSQQLTVIHCDEPNTGFEPRLISAHFFCPLVWLAVTIYFSFLTVYRIIK